MRSIKLQVKIKRVVLEKVSITFLNDACACIVRKSASSNITTLRGLNDITLANPDTLSLIVSMPLSSEALI
jgi:hypothetical protein